TIGCEPATRVSLGAGASAAGALSLTDGLACGRVAACLVSACLVSAGFDDAAFGVAASCRGACSPRLASAFGFAGDGGGVVAVVSAVPPKPILRARLLKKPSDCAVGAADATRVGAAGAGVGADAGAATTGSSAPGACGGLTVEGIVPGARENPESDRLWPSPPSDNPVLPPGTRAANTWFMPPSMPVLSFATGVPFATSFAYSA